MPLRPHIGLTLCILVMPATISFATVLNTGDQRVFIDAIGASDSSLHGAVLVDEQIPPPIDNLLLPVIHATVIQRADTGTLDYYFTLLGGTEPNTGFVVNGFSATPVDVFKAQDVAATFVPPTQAIRSAATPQEITISTPLGSLPGFFLIRTQDTILTSNQTLSYINAGDTGTGDPVPFIYQLEATSPLPETSSLTLLPLAVAALGVRKLWRA